MTGSLSWAFFVHSFLSHFLNNCFQIFLHLLLNPLSSLKPNRGTWTRDFMFEQITINSVSFPPKMCRYHVRSDIVLPKSVYENSILFLFCHINPRCKIQGVLGDPRPPNQPLGVPKNKLIMTLCCPLWKNRLKYRLSGAQCLSAPVFGVFN